LEYSGDNNIAAITAAIIDSVDGKVSIKMFEARDSFCDALHNDQESYESRAILIIKREDAVVKSKVGTWPEGMPDGLKWRTWPVVPHPRIVNALDNMYSFEPAFFQQMMCITERQFWKYQSIGLYYRDYSEFGGVEMDWNYSPLTQVDPSFLNLGFENIKEEFSSPRLWATITSRHDSPEKNTGKYTCTIYRFVI
jgi:hypothetical protein